MAVLLVSLPLGFMVIGPIATYASNIVGNGFLALFNFSPILCGALTGLLWQVLVIFGLHWGLVPIAMSNLMTMGFDTILVGAFVPSFAQTAVVAAMYFKLKDKKMKELCIPAIISGICGVTEPAIYGITLPRKKTIHIQLCRWCCSRSCNGSNECKKLCNGWTWNIWYT